jgi:hypothetical protein
LRRSRACSRTRGTSHLPLAETPRDTGESGRRDDKRETWTGFEFAAAGRSGAR